MLKQYDATLYYIQVIMFFCSGWVALEQYQYRSKSSLYPKKEKQCKQHFTVTVGNMFMKKEKN